MAEASLPPDIARRISDLETRLENLTRVQKPPAPGLFDLADVSGQVVPDASVLTYSAAIGRWQPAASTWGFVGMVTWHAGTAAPPGSWALCNGASASTTGFAGLFAVIGYTYGGSGSSFNLPNIASRMVIGAGTDSLGATGGARTVTLSSSEMPSHTHSEGATRYSGTTSHTHSGIGGIAEGANPDSGLASPVPVTNSTGGGGAHQNLPPYIALNAYIRY